MRQRTAGNARNGGPDTIRTCDLSLRRGPLYPTELRSQVRKHTGKRKCGQSRPIDLDPRADEAGRCQPYPPARPIHHWKRSIPTAPDQRRLGRRSTKGNENTVSGDTRAPPAPSNQTIAHEFIREFQTTPDAGATCRSLGLMGLPSGASRGRCQQASGSSRQVPSA